MTNVAISMSHAFGNDKNIAGRNGILTMGHNMAAASIQHDDQLNEIMSVEFDIQFVMDK